jgi:uncharacterized protein (DUF433 family)
MIHKARRHKRILAYPRVIEGTRITVELILRKRGAGMMCEEIIDHPHLMPEDVRAAQAFAADYLADEAVILA